MMRRRYLIVDDAPTIRACVRSLMVRLGVPENDIAMADCGRYALYVVQAFRPDVILLDIELPGMDGGEVARRVWAERPDARIAVMTGIDRRSPRVQNLISHGAFDVLPKPVRLDALDAFLSNLDREAISIGRVR